MRTQFISKNIFWRFRDLAKCLYELQTHDRSNLDLSKFISTCLPNSKVVHSLGFSSGRSALLFALKCLHALNSDRKEVIVPTYTCNGVIDPIFMAGLIPIFCSIKDDLNIDVESCLERLNSNTLAVIVPHVYGFPAQVQLLYRSIKSIDGGVFVIDDASAGMGNKLNGEFLGTIGDLGVFSLNQAKPFPATGGGVLTICSGSLVETLLRSYKDTPSFPIGRKTIEAACFALNYSYPMKSLIFKYFTTKHFGKDFIPIIPQYFYRISRFDISLLIATMQSARVHHISRFDIMKKYYNELYGCENIYFPHPPGDYFLSRYSVVIPGLGSTLKSSRMILERYRREGIFFQRGYPYVARSDHSKNGLEKSITIGDDVLILPVNHDIPLNEYSKVVNAVYEISRCV